MIYIYIVETLEGKLLLKTVKSGIPQAIPIENVRKSFIFASCSTCHSAQGCSVNDDITILILTIFWLRTIQSITQARDLNQTIIH